MQSMSIIAVAATAAAAVAKSRDDYLAAWLRAIVGHAMLVRDS